MPAMGSIEENGWKGPHKKVNNRIDTLENTTDYHVWRVEKYNNGAIIGYPEQLIPLCQYGTNRIVRKPWPEHLPQNSTKSQQTSTFDNSKTDYVLWQ